MFVHHDENGFDNREKYFHEQDSHQKLLLYKKLYDVIFIYATSQIIILSYMLCPICNETDTYCV